MRAHSRSLLGGALAAAAIAAGCTGPAARRTDRDASLDLGMVWIPPPTRGWFVMGAAARDLDARPDERPAHRVGMHGFWMDRTEVTNAQFSAFVEATGYVTTAERPVDWESLRVQLPPGTPRPPEDRLAPGSLVFRPPQAPRDGARVPLDDPSLWWVWTPGASWRHPEGPGSAIEGRMNHPVVQVSHDDALAYARWAAKRLPTEAEWEYAARGGVEGGVFAWAEDAGPGMMRRANLWQGEFPVHNEASEQGASGRARGDGFAGTAPVGSFPPNGFGLHDMAGNVWEWCVDWYRADRYAIDQERLDAAFAEPPLPSGEPPPRDRREAERVIRGGSFLCNECYCAGYRASARMHTSPDTGLMHLGFRCVRDDPAR